MVGAASNFFLSFLAGSLSLIVRRHPAVQDVGLLVRSLDQHLCVKDDDQRWDDQHLCVKDDDQRWGRRPKGKHKWSDSFC